MPESLDVEFEEDTYRVTYSVENGMIHVRSTYDLKHAVIGATPPEALARIIAIELLTEAKRQGMLSGCHRGPL